MSERREARRAAEAASLASPVEREDCPCAKRGCPRHGRCAACRERHAPKPPRCER
jgi:hypothetical protein